MDASTHVVVGANSPVWVRALEVVWGQLKAMGNPPKVQGERTHARTVRVVVKIVAVQVAKAVVKVAVEAHAVGNVLLVVRKPVPLLAKENVRALVREVVKVLVRLVAKIRAKVVAKPNVTAHVREIVKAPVLEVVMVGRICSQAPIK